MQTIDRAHPVTISIGDEPEHATTWGQFLDDNRDGFDTAEAARIERDLLKRPGCTAFGGGGAAAKWTIRLLMDDELTRAIWKQAEEMCVPGFATPLWKSVRGVSQ